MHRVHECPRRGPQVPTCLDKIWSKVTEPPPRIVVNFVTPIRLSLAAGSERTVLGDFARLQLLINWRAQHRTSKAFAWLRKRTGLR